MTLESLQLYLFLALTIGIWLALIWAILSAIKYFYDEYSSYWNRLKRDTREAYIRGYNHAKQGISPLYEDK